MFGRGVSPFTHHSAPTGMVLGYSLTQWLKSFTLFSLAGGQGMSRITGQVGEQQMETTV